MERIRIISDPYRKEIHYETWQEKEDTWHRINPETDGNNPLLSEELSHGVFPFIVKKIVDSIIVVYRDSDERIEIVFEGTDDEYRELELLCAGDEYSESVVLIKGGKYLENARDILPDIIDVFNELSPLISESVKDKEKIRNELEKFSDASKAVIPICVLGNYSSGKSTFINALIGSEILPSSDAPMTARIYRIARSRYQGRAEIGFTIGEEKVSVRIGEDNYKIASAREGDPLLGKLRDSLETNNTQPISQRVCRALEIVNAADDSISDLIELSVPFVGGEWDKTQNEFVIFDTPGSNSASNEKHFEVLQKAMKDLSNGLPVFVSEYNSLDSTDNDRLYRVIREIEELDSRFTMIVVNKADIASLPKGGFPKETQEHILGEAVPRQLYSEGIYFVSSVLGLGSKNGGDFLDDHYAEIFEDQKQKYSDTSSRFYKRLYLYNIMPEQLKQQAMLSAEKCGDLIYANSGLFSVEEGIQTFASKYSSYNKCQQSQHFLSKLIEVTKSEIETAKVQRESSRKVRNEALERDTRELMESLESTCQEREYKAVLDYLDKVEAFVWQSEEKCVQESLYDEQEMLEKQQQIDRNYKGLREDLISSAETVKGTLMGDLQSLVKTPGLSAVKKLGANFYDNAKEVLSNTEAVLRSKKQITKEVAEQLVLLLNNDIEKISKEAVKQIDAESRIHLETEKQEIKNALIQVVTGAESLTEKRKKDLSDIIIHFGEVERTEEKDEFQKKDYEIAIRLGNTSIGFTDLINLEKLRRDYNTKLHSLFQSIYSDISASHIASFNEWLQRLMDVLEHNIIEYSPSLRNQAELIGEETARIHELEQKQRLLADYTDQIREMMAWKEA